MNLNGLNLHDEIADAINEVVPRSPIRLFTFSQQQNVKGVMSPVYNFPVDIVAQVELESGQQLQHLYNTNLTTALKRFYISSYDLTGLNRNLSTAGDYIEMDGLKYKIVQVQENFKVGWVCVIGAESTQIN